MYAIFVVFNVSLSIPLPREQIIISHPFTLQVIGGLACAHLLRRRYLRTMKKQTWRAARITRSQLDVSSIDHYNSK